MDSDARAMLEEEVLKRLNQCFKGMEECVDYFKSSPSLGNGLALLERFYETDTLSLSSIQLIKLFTKE